MKMRLKFLVVVVAFVLSLTSCEEDLILSGGEANREQQSSDKYIGDFRKIEIHDALAKFDKSECVLYILAPDQTVIKRNCIHVREGSLSSLTLDFGLKDGTYHLLYVEYDLDTPLDNGRITKWRVGLGCKVTISNHEFVMGNVWDPDMELYGEGTKENPYQISSDDHLRTLAAKTNDSHYNRLITHETCFSQVNDIDLGDMSFDCDNIQGWSPIGTSNTTPFRGQYYGNNKKISNLQIQRYDDDGVGLFGFTDGAYLNKIVIKDSRISGNAVVGALVGCVSTSGGVRNTTLIDTCMLESGVDVVGIENRGGFSIGGLVGCVEELAIASINACSTGEDVTVSSCLNAGGLVGSTFMYSKTIITNCTNNATVTSQYSGCGGIIATGDSLDIVNCKNYGKIQGSTLYTGAEKTAGIGTGGIVGGSGLLNVSISVNYGTIEGKDGVGGIIGSTRIQGDENTPYVYNTTVTTFCGNEGSVSGQQGVGGICGEGQFGAFAVYNTGKISGLYQVGGIVGSTSVGVVHNAVNTGSVSGKSYVGGVIGKTNFGSFAIDHNYGDVTASESHAGGILGLGSNNTMINYCGNHASVYSAGEGPSGGIVGEIGDPSEWTAMNTAECILGSVEMIMGIVGPCIAIYEKAGGEPSKAIIGLEKVTEIALLLIDGYLYIDGCIATFPRERVEKIITTLQADYSSECAKVENKISGLRSSYGSFSVNPFYAGAFSIDYLKNIEDLLVFYKGSDANGELFNNNINDKRYKRANKLEKFSYAADIVHATIAGVCIVVGTAATAASFFVAPGSTPAVAWAVAGGISALAGGSNTIWKTSTDYAENAVYVTQCVNTGYVRSADNSSDKVGGIVGVMHDYGIISDCLNSGHGNTEGGGHFVGSMKVRSELLNSLTIANINGWNDLIGDTPAESYKTDNIYYCSDESNQTSVPNVYMRPSYNIPAYRSKGLTTAQISQKSSYDLDLDSLWTLSAQPGAFPIPYKSEYQLN